MNALARKIRKYSANKSMPENFYFKDQKRGRKSHKFSERDLIDLESKLGARIFGDAPKNGRREFFNLDRDTWIWHEQWTDGAGNVREITTRYEIQDQQIIKIQPGPRYVVLKGDELKNFVAAVEQYYALIKSQVYRR